ncbi:MAG: corrinoid protein [Syntrophaceae bacterium]|nr:corrinoid protein [Syntrophaceae bacterium]
MTGEDIYLNALKEALLEMDYDKMKKAAEEAMAAGIDPLKAVTEALSAAMVIIGEKFQSGEYYLPELIVAGDVMKEGMKIIGPYMRGKNKEPGKKFVIAAVEGDNHDIGKNIVGTLLSARGFEVVDLGVDVPARRIVDAVKEQRPVILGLSALLTVTMPKMGEVIQALKEAGLRNSLKVIIGGTSVTPEFARKIGADHSSTDAAEGVEKCVQWASPGKGR